MMNEWILIKNNNDMMIDEIMRCYDKHVVKLESWVWLDSGLLWPVRETLGNVSPEY